jgi:hypothetical protein
MKAGCLARFDYEYQRNGTANLSFSAPSAQTLESTSKSDLSSIAPISASSMTSTPSLAPWASKRRDTGAKREQNPHQGHYNGLIANQITHLDGRWPLSFIRFNSMRD